MKPIRILLVIPTLDRSGAEKQLMLLATRLPRTEFDVRVVALTRGGPYAEDLERHGIPVTVLGKRWKFDPVCLWRLRRIVREWRPDIVHTWLFAANSFGRMVAGGPGQPPVIVSERCVDSWKSGWQLRLDRWQIRRTSRLVGNSRSVADFYQQLGYPEPSLRVIFNGMEAPEASEPYSLAERDRLRLQLAGIPAQAHVLGFVGRLAPQKRLQDLLWMEILIANIRSDVYLLIVGDGPERARLEQFARSLNVETQVVFVGHQADVGAYLRLMDVFCLASDFEGMSNSVMEAMSAGLPVLASDIPPNRELVVDGETGCLIPVGDRAAYAREALRLIDHPDVAHKMGKAGQARIRTEFGIPRMVDAYAALYREVCGH